MSSRIKFAVVIGLAHASNTERFYRQHALSETSLRLTHQLKKLLRSAAEAVGFPFHVEEIASSISKTYMLFDQALQAHEFATNLFRRADSFNQSSNARPGNDDLRFFFRVGISRESLEHSLPDRATFARAERLEELARPESGGVSGEILMFKETFADLPNAVRKLYSKTQSPELNPDERVDIYKCKTVDCAPWEIITRPPQSSTKPQIAKECFVISPIDEQDSRIREVFEQLIAPACKELGFRPVRADQVAGPDRIPVITKRLTQAPLAIAYMGDPYPKWNDDVMLEIGFRLSTGLPLILLSEQPKARDSKPSPSLKEVLPFHLANKTVVIIQGKPESALSRVVEEGQCILDAPAKQDWKTVHPVIRMRFTNLKKDLELVYVSQEAADMFELDLNAPVDIAKLQSTFKARMEKNQYDEYMSERMRTFNAVMSTHMGFVTVDSDTEIPVARIPIVFKSEQASPADKPLGYLPIIVRSSASEGMMYLEVCYLKVSESLRWNAKGYWSCDL